MKPTKSILILLSLFLISNCGDKVREEITERYDNGSKKLLVRYKGEGVDEIVVERITYSESGDTLILEKPLDNMTIERKYYTNGNIREEVHYKGGFSYGNRNVIKYWSEDGELLVNDGNGKVIDYYGNGKIERKGNYIDGRQEGKWISYWDNGNIFIQENYIYSKRDGEKIVFNENGTINNKINYKDGKQEGKYIKYFENGKINRDGNFTDNKLEGWFIKYYDNGNKRMEGNYKDGEMDGKWIFYFEGDGRKKSEGYYKNNEPINITE